MLRDPNVSGGVMPGRRAQRICQGGTSGPSGIAMRNVSVRGKDGDTSDTLRTHTGRHTSAVTCTRDPVYGHKRVCGSATVTPPGQALGWRLDVQ
mgnify:CR=1 FL=1